MRHPYTSHRLVPLALVLLVASLADAAAAGQGGDRPLAVIDALVHTTFDGKPFAESAVTFSKDALAAEMKLSHVVGAVSMNRPGDPMADLSDLNIVSCANLVGTEDPAAVEAGLASRAYRCLTIYLGYVNRYAYDPAYDPTYRLAEKYRVPVVFYLGGSAPKYGEPHTVERAARSHPNVTFVLAHAAEPRTIAQREREEFLTRRQPFLVHSFARQTALAAEVATRNPNVVVDGSGLLIGDLARYPRDQIDEYLVKPLRSAFHTLGNPAKLMFATGWPVTRIGPYLDAYRRAIPREYWPAVLHDNAARVYGLQ